MKTGRRIGILLLALVALGAVLWSQFQGRQDEAVRQELARVLGEGPPPPDSAREAPLSGWLRDPFARLPEALMKLGGGLEIQETPQAYVLQVPVRSAEEAEQVRVQATPNRIEVSGERALGEHGRSSFFQSFSTSSEIAPEAMTRRLEDGRLTITLPKKQAGKAASPQPSSPSSPQPSIESPLSPEAVQELLDKEARSI